MIDVYLIIIAIIGFILYKYKLLHSIKQLLFILPIITMYLKKDNISKLLHKSNNNYKLVVFRSNKHIYGQILDTNKGITLFSSSSFYY